MSHSIKEFNAQLFGMRIEKVRLEQHMTREELADACNITAVHVRHIENGTRLPSVPVFVLLCNALRVTPTYFLADFIDLKAGLPDAYAKAVDILLSASPCQAEIIVAMLETMNKMLDKNSDEE